MDSRSTLSMIFKLATAIALVYTVSALPEDTVLPEEDFFDAHPQDVHSIQHYNDESNTRTAPAPTHGTDNYPSAARNIEFVDDETQLFENVSPIEFTKVPEIVVIDNDDETTKHTSKGLPEHDLLKTNVKTPHHNKDRMLMVPSKSKKGVARNTAQAHSTKALHDQDMLIRTPEKTSKDARKIHSAKAFLQNPIQLRDNLLTTQLSGGKNAAQAHSRSAKALQALDTQKTVFAELMQTRSGANQQSFKHLCRCAQEAERTLDTVTGYNHAVTQDLIFRYKTGRENCDATIHDHEYQVAYLAVHHAYESFQSLRKEMNEFLKGDETRSILNQEYFVSVKQILQCQQCMKSATQTPNSTCTGVFFQLNKCEPDCSYMNSIMKKYTKKADDLHKKQFLVRWNALNVAAKSLSTLHATFLSIMKSFESRQQACFCKLKDDYEVWKTKAASLMSASDKIVREAAQTVCAVHNMTGKPCVISNQQKQNRREAFCKNRLATTATIVQPFCDPFPADDRPGKPSSCEPWLKFAMKRHPPLDTAIGKLKTSGLKCGLNHNLAWNRFNKPKLPTNNEDYGIDYFFNSDCSSTSGLERCVQCPHNSEPERLDDCEDPTNLWPGVAGECQPGAIMGRIYYAFQKDKRYCYHITIGSVLDQDFTTKNEAQCNADGFSKDVTMGRGNGGGSHTYPNGDSAHCPGGKKRNARVEVVQDPSAKETSASVTEPSACDYIITITTPKC